MRVLGLLILIMGAVFLALGVFYTFSVAEEVVQGVSGQPNNSSLFILGGLMLILGGSGMLLLSGRQK